MPPYRGCSPAVDTVGGGRSFTLLPPLTDIEPQPIRPATLTGRWHPAHPSPSRDGLALEVMSPRELSYWGQIFGVDVPYLMAPAGWGEWLPLVEGGG